MDKKYEILTLIKGNHKYGNNDYVLGRISGIGYCMSGNKSGYSIIRIEEGHVYRNEFTAADYDDFMNEIEKLYPGLCQFDYRRS